jgi:NifB/MoaA-like Fe-S oxidoreductase
MRDYHLIRRRGVLLRDENYIISVLRHRFDPLQFKIIAASADLGEEFILDLQARDLFELTEGRNQLLEVNEPSALVEALLDNLSITIN